MAIASIINIGSCVYYCACCPTGQLVIMESALNVNMEDVLERSCVCSNEQCNVGLHERERRVVAAAQADREGTYQVLGRCFVLLAQQEVPVWLPALVVKGDDADLI